MYLLWLRVAVALYAASCVAVVPAVLYGMQRWRQACTHLAGLGFFFHFVSMVERGPRKHIECELLKLKSRAVGPSRCSLDSANKS